MVKNKLVCFDVDGTLVENKTSWLTLTQGLGCSIPQVLSVFDQVMSGKIPFAAGERQVADLFRASGAATRNNIEKIFEEEVLKPEAAQTVEFLKRKGHTVWLISGAIDIHVASIAAKVGADGFYASASLQFDDQDVLSGINYGGNQSEWKAQMVLQLAGEFGLVPDDVVFVGDGENDIEAFKLTGRGIAIRPYDERLEKLSWKTINSLADIRNIL